MNNKVSVIIPTYNRGEYLRKISIPSVLRQTWRNVEIIIVDDGSTDNTKSVVEFFCENDSRVKYFYKENGGQGSARNFGLKKSSGDFVIFLDSDDAFLGDALKIFLEVQNSKNYDIVFSNVLNIGNNNGKFFIKGVEKGVFIPSSTFYIKKLFERLPLFSEDRDLIGIEDTDLWFSWSEALKRKHEELKVKLIKYPLVFYFEHDAQITKANKEHIFDIFKAFISKHEPFVKYLSPKDASWMFFRFAHLSMLLKKKDLARSFARKGFMQKGGIKKLFFLIALSYFSPSFYKIFVSPLFNIRILIKKKFYGIVLRLLSPFNYKKELNYY